MTTDFCIDMMNSFFELDKNQFLPPKMIVHLLTCKKCRTTVRLLTSAEKASAKPLGIRLPVTDTAVESIMKKIEGAHIQPVQNTKPITLTRWILCGLVMILAMFPFSSFTKIILPNADLLLSFYLLFAGIVTTYCALFVGSNLDFFIKQIGIKKLPAF